MRRDGLLKKLPVYSTRPKQILGSVLSSLKVPSGTVLDWHETVKGLKMLCLLLLLFPIIYPAFGQDYPDRFLNGEIQTIQSDILKQDRVVFVYLPENYEETDAAYPVHYVTDAAGPSNVFYSLLRLHARYDNSMPPGIVVGLSSDDREHNLHVEKGAKAYLDFLEMEVIPFIEAHYRTASFRSIAGHSLGGGFAIYAFLNRNDLFNACIAGSPYPLAYLSNEIDSGAAFINTEAYRFLYASIGTVNDISKPEFDRFIETISEVAPDNLKLHFQIHDGENHASNVAVNFQDGLEALYADWKFVLPDTPGETVDALLARHYDRLSKKIGYLVKPDEWEVIFPVMDALAKRGDFDNAIRVIKYGLELYPQSDQAYAFLARAYVSIGDKESASVNVEKALSINPQNKFALHVKSLLGN